MFGSHPVTVEGEQHAAGGIAPSEDDLLTRTFPEVGGARQDATTIEAMTIDVTVQPRLAPNGPNTTTDSTPAVPTRRHADDA
jgi:hypothetical protein